MLVFYILLSVAVSFLCSILEAAILSATPTYITTLKKNDPSLYKRISYLIDDIEKPLASILTLNTIAHTIGAAGAGAEAQKAWGNEYLSLFSAVLTFIILFFSEIIPKSIGARAWKYILPTSHIFLKPMIFISYPIVWISIKISKLIKGNEQIEISRDEIPAMAELGLHSGAIHKSEFEHLRSLIDFAKVRLFDVLRPNDKVQGLKYDTHINDALSEIQSNTYSRLLVFGTTREDVKGYVMRKDILQSYINKEDIKISQITKKILILEKDSSAQETFNRLLGMKAHIAAIINADGEFLGIVTLEDLIENLTGTKIYDEFDQSN